MSIVLESGFEADSKVSMYVAFVWKLRELSTN